MTLNDLFNKLTNFKMRMKGVEEIMVSNLPICFRIGRKTYYPKEIDVKIMVGWDKNDLNAQPNFVGIEFKKYDEEE